MSLFTRHTGARGYYGYRGRRPGGSGKGWLVVLLLLILLAAIAFLLAQRYMVYTKDGSQHFELPWLRSAASTEPKPPNDARQNLEIVIEQPLPVQIADKEMHALELDAATLQSGTARVLESLAPEINSVAIRLRNARGELLYPSALPAAQEAKAVTGSSIAGAAIAELTASGYYTVARLSALHDNLFSFAHMTDAAVLQLKYRNYIWYAPDNSFYLAPEKELTRQYLSDIAAEVAALGFNELLFDEFGYPTNGRQNNIDASGRGMSKEEALSLLAAALREAVSESGVRLSLWMDESVVLAGGDAKSGQQLAALGEVFDRIYVPTTEERIPALDAAMASCRAELIPVLAAPPAEGRYLIAQ